MRLRRKILLSAAAMGAGLLGGQGIHHDVNGAEAATQKHELRVIAGLPGAESNVTTWDDAGNSGECYWRYTCHEDPLDTNDMIGSRAHQNAYSEAQQLRGLAGAALLAQPTPPPPGGGGCGKTPC